MSRLISRRSFIGASALAAAGLAVGPRLASPQRAHAWANPYSDVPAGHWLVSDGVLEFHENQDLMRGSGGRFRPGDTLKREEAAVVLYKAFTGDAGSVAPTNLTPLADVAAGRYYTQSVNWCYLTGVAVGVSPTSFGVGQAVSRQQLAAMLYKAVSLVWGRASDGADITGYADYGDVAAWARPAVSYLVAAGAMGGDPGGRLSPTRAATRAEVAKMVMKVILFADPQRESSKMIPVNPEGEGCNALPAEFVCFDYATEATSLYRAPGAPDFVATGDTPYAGIAPGSVTNSALAFDLDTLVSGNNPDAIIGDDDRYRVLDYSLHPFSAIGYLQATTDDALSQAGTGTLVSRNSMVTAAVTLFGASGSADGETRYFYHDLFAVFGNGSAPVYGDAIFASRAFIPVEYFEEARTTFDFGLVVFENLMGPDRGYMGFDSSADTTRDYLVSGYPLIPPAGFDPDDLNDSWAQYAHACQGLMGAQEDAVIFENDTTYAQIGAALAYQVGSTYYCAIGLYSDGEPDVVNYGTRFTGAKYRALCATRVNGEPLQEQSQGSSYLGGQMFYFGSGNVAGGNGATRDELISDLMNGNLTSDLICAAGCSDGVETPLFFAHRRSAGEGTFDSPDLAMFEFDKISTVLFNWRSLQRGDIIRIKGTLKSSSVILIGSSSGADLSGCAGMPLSDLRSRGDLTTSSYKVYGANGVSSAEAIGFDGDVALTEEQQRQLSNYLAYSETGLKMYIG